MVWIMCWEIPLHAWDLENIRKIVERVGEVVDVDEDVEDFQRLDRARVLVKMPWTPIINHIGITSINGVDYVVKIV